MDVARNNAIVVGQKKVNLIVNEKITLEDCIINAKKFSSFKDWGTNSSLFYLACTKNDWLNDVDNIFPEGDKRGQISGKFKHSFEKRFATYKDWAKHSYKYYLAASRYNWLKEIKESFQ